MIDSDFTHNTCQEIAEDASKTRGDSDDDRLLAGEAIDAVLKGQGKLRTYTQTFTALRTALFVWLEYVKARHAVMRLEDRDPELSAEELAEWDRLNTEDQNR